MQFRIEGAEKATGKDRAITVEAENKADALAQAEGFGLVISSVTAVAAADIGYGRPADKRAEAMSPRKKWAYVAAVYVTIMVVTLVAHVQNGNGDEAPEAMFWLTIIYAVVIGVGVWVIRISGAVLASGEAARQQLRK